MYNNASFHSLGPTLNVIQKEDVTRNMGTIPPSLPPPPSYWGENRAKFSDVVARSQEISSFSNLNKSQTNTANLLPTFNTDVKDVQYAKPESAHDISPTTKEYGSISKPVPSLCVKTVEKDKAIEPDPIILQPDPQQSNSYFSDTFTERPVSHNFESRPFTNNSSNTSIYSVVSTSSASWYRMTIFQKLTSL